MFKGLIAKEEIEDISNEILKFLEVQKIKEVKDLAGKVGTNLAVADKPGHSITIESRPSNGNTSAYTLSYLVSGKGIPVEVRLNPALGYTKTFVKGDLKRVKDYSHFATDEFGNRAYERKSAECSISSLKEGLEILIEK